MPVLLLMMAQESKPTLLRRLKGLLIGGERSPRDRSIFHKISLVALLAWIGMGADGLSSSSYGPPEAFKHLGDYPHLGLFVALATGITIFVISTSYSQIIELFPSGGGGYVVASKLLSPRVGMVAGCALLVDYVLTIAVSISSGVDAILSYFPYLLPYRLTFVVAGLLALMVMNMRGVRESVAMLAPIFVVFVLTHAFVIVYTLVVHAGDMSTLVADTGREVGRASATLGAWGVVLLIVRAYSMGAGTYTGIEAVSNGLPVLREPRVQTGKRVMTYMWISLSVTVVGLMLAYLLFRVQFQPGKTLNAALMDQVTKDWGAVGQPFAMVTLFSEGLLLFVAAQAGFLDGPRVLASMAMDRWFPGRFSLLSERLVTQNGVLLIAAGAVAAVLSTGASVEVLVVLYSINVFITFLLSQTGMVRHWWMVRGQAAHWRKKLFVNGVGMSLTLLILVWVVIGKFHEGGWLTLVVTFGLVVVVSLIRRHYNSIRPLAEKLNTLTGMVATTGQRLAETSAQKQAPPEPKRSAKTAVVMVSGFNGFGVHTLLNIIRFFGDTFQNYVFVEVGVVDAGNFKGVREVENLEKHVRQEVEQYVQFVQGHGYYAEGRCLIGRDVAEEISRAAGPIVEKFPNSVFFAGQVILPKDSILTRWLHNNVVFAVQRRLYRQGVPFVVLPIRV